jgi:hypothetical protein
MSPPPETAGRWRPRLWHDGGRAGRATARTRRWPSQVGEAVAAVYGERAHGGSGDDALILLREPQRALAETIPLLNGFHQARS